MSQENVRVVQRFFEAMERLLEGWDTSRSVLEAMSAGDIPPEAMEALGCLSPEVEWNPVFSGETYRGQLELGRAMEELLQAAETYSTKLLDIIDLENDRVLAVFGLNLEGKTSGIQVSAAMFAIVTLQDGLIARLDEYTDRREDLEAAGVTE
jgi:ketosteroid isomerase-like protein